MDLVMSLPQLHAQRRLTDVVRTESSQLLDLISKDALHYPVSTAEVLRIELHCSEFQLYRSWSICKILRYWLLIVNYFAKFVRQLIL